MSSWDDKSKRKGKTYGRRPYIEGETGSYPEMMEEIPRKAMLDQRWEKKSQFDKPYLEDDYHDMEHFQPPPTGRLNLSRFNAAWPGGMGGKGFPSFSGPVPTGLDLPGGEAWCGLTLQPPANCIKPVEGVLSIIHGFTEAELWSGLRVYKNGARHRNYDFEGAVRPLRIYSDPDPDTKDCDWAVWPATMDKIQAEIWTKNDDGVPVFRCKHKINVFCTIPAVDCCTDLPDGAFTWNTSSNPTTIASGGNATIYVQGGCPPYTWTVSGTGAIWNGSGTSTLQSSFTSEVLDLADGT